MMLAWEGLPYLPTPNRTFLFKCARWSNYAQAVEPFRQTDRLSDDERAMLMGGACAKAYGWSPTKG